MIVGEYEFCQSSGGVGAPEGDGDMNFDNCEMQTYRIRIRSGDRCQLGRRRDGRRGLDARWVRPRLVCRMCPENIRQTTNRHVLYERVN